MWSVLFGQLQTHSVKTKPSGLVRQAIFVLAHSSLASFTLGTACRGIVRRAKFEKYFQVIKSGDITDEGLSVCCEVFATMALVKLENKAIISVSTIFSHYSTFTFMT
ncbi:TPA: hypothetical protein ACH3X2_002537 [Trebouxia sp. C0005]